jgi:hypothetical protein
MDGKVGRDLADFCQIDGLELLEIQGGTPTGGFSAEYQDDDVCFFDGDPKTGGCGRWPETF